MNKILKQNNISYYFKNGEPCICPFRTPVIIPAKLGGVDLVQPQCNSSCPLFHLEIENNKAALTIKCCVPQQLINCDYEQAQTGQIKKA